MKLPHHIICSIAFGACIFITGCGHDATTTKSPQKLSDADTADMDYAVSLLSCPAPVGRFQIHQFSTGVCVLDTALGDLYVFRGNNGWLKYPSPLRKPISSFSASDFPATNKDGLEIVAPPPGYVLDKSTDSFGGIRVR